MTASRFVLHRLLAGAAIALVSTSVVAQTPAELYATGVAARTAQDFPAAVTALEAAAEIEPDNADVLVQLGFASLGMDNLESATAAFDRALAIAPNYADARFGLAQIAVREGDTGKAEALAEGVLAINPDNPDATALLASLRRVTPEPVPVAAPVIVVTQNPAVGLLSQARDARLAGDFGNAAAQSRRALSLSPGNADALLEIGLAESALGNSGAAEGYFAQVLAIAPDYADARLGLVRLAIAAGDTAQARALIAPVLVDAPGRTDAMLLAGRIEMIDGDYRAAEAAFEAVMAREPDNIDALVGLGDAARALGDGTVSRSAWERAITLDPAREDVLARLSAAPLRKWRLDFGSEVSHLSQGLASWSDSAVAISYTLNPTTSLSGRFRRVTRFDLMDVEFEGVIAHQFQSGLFLVGGIAFAPDPNFLAKYSLGLGGEWRPEVTEGRSPVAFTLELGHDVYSDTTITTVSPGLKFFLQEDRIALDLNWLHSFDDTGFSTNGYTVQGAFAATDRLTLLGGYANAPEISLGTLLKTEIISGGAIYAISDTFGLRLDVAHETRNAFVRDTVGLGVTVRF